MKTEWIDGMCVSIGEDIARASDVSCSKHADIARRISSILKKHKDWEVNEVCLKRSEDGLDGEISFKIPPPEKKRIKKYEVSWVEHELCYSTVYAPNKKVAKEEAMHNFPDSREWDASTDWVIEEVKD